LEVGGKFLSQTGYGLLQVIDGGPPFGSGFSGHFQAGAAKVGLQAGNVAGQVFNKTMPRAAQGHNLATQPGHIVG
jgi:hypothetical protein